MCCAVELGVKEQSGFKTAKAWVEVLQDKMPVRKLLQGKGSNAGTTQEYGLETSSYGYCFSTEALLRWF